MIKKFTSALLSLIMVINVFSLSAFSAYADGAENNHDTNPNEQVDPDTCEHIWSEWFSDNNATYFDDGTKWRYCPICDTTQKAVDEGSKLKANEGWLEIDGFWYYFDASSNIVTNSWMMDSVGWCYLGSDGKMATEKWIADSWGWCYLGSDGRMVKDAWAMDSTGWCYLDEYGYMVSSTWKMDSVGWCYIDSTGHMVTDKWVADSIGWCYLGADGRMVKNAWATDSTGWCYLNDYGYMVTDSWAIDSHDWVYLDSTGHIVYNTWLTDSMGWCYMGSDGYISRSSWLFYNGYWYYFDETGHMVYNTWKYIDGYQYYFYWGGQMASSTTIDGYWVDSSGKYNPNGVLSSEYIEKIENRFLDLINEERNSKGVHSLTTNGHLYNCSKQRSIEQITFYNEYGGISHTRPNGEDCFTVIDYEKYPYTFIGENVGFYGINGNADDFNDDDVEMVAVGLFDAFVNSKDHYANIMNSRFDETGVGISCEYTDGTIRIFITQLFGTTTNN